MNIKKHLTIEETFRLAIQNHSEKKLDIAQELYQQVLKIDPNHLGAHNNLGVIFIKLKEYTEAIHCFNDVLKINPNFVSAYNNLGIILHKQNKYNEAESSYRKAIELKPDYIEAFSNLGVTLKEMNKFDEAETVYKKIIEMKPDHQSAYKNLDMLVQDKKLLNHIFEKNKSLKKDKVSSVDSNFGLTSNPFITHRNVESKLLRDVYKSELKELNKTKDGRYGNGKCSDFKFLENDLTTIKCLREDLTKIMSLAVKSKIFIYDSFLNIYGPGSGSEPHNHIRSFDKNQGLINQKFSLTYYLSVGDQNCSEPGHLQLYNPPEEIKLSEGTIIIIPSTRKHNAVYGGKTDRIMIGINFYSL
jgi:hypothetical protein